MGAEADRPGILSPTNPMRNPHITWQTKWKTAISSPSVTSSRSVPLSIGVGLSWQRSLIFKITGHRNRSFTYPGSIENQRNDEDRRDRNCRPKCRKPWAFDAWKKPTETNRNRKTLENKPKLQFSRFSDFSENCNVLAPQLLAPQKMFMTPPCWRLGALRAPGPEVAELVAQPSKIWKKKRICLPPGLQCFLRKTRP